MSRHGMIDTPHKPEMKEAMHGSSREFWKKHSIRDKAPQPGNSYSGGQKRVPSESSELSPEKARKILSHGEVRGKKLTKKQRGMFGAIAGRGD